MKYVLCFLTVLSFAFAQDAVYEENWRIAADVLHREVTEKCACLLPKRGCSVEAVAARYGKPREMSLPNGFKIRRLEFPFDVYGEEHGLRTVFPCTMIVTFLEDRVVESAFTMPNLDNRNSLLSERGLTRADETHQTRFNLLFRAKGYLERVEVEFVRRKIIEAPGKPPEPTAPSGRGSP